MNNFKFLIGIPVLLFLIIISCKDTKDQKIQLDQKTEAYVEIATDDTSCLSDSSWFHVDPVSGKRKTPAPAEDSTSVFGNNVTVSNCNFHQWSWQKFLWLTNDVSGRPLFMDSLIQVNSHTVPVTTVDKKIVLSSMDNIQATGDILNTNKSFGTNNTSHTVYYSIHVDSTLYKSIHKYAPMEKTAYADATFPVGALELKIAWVAAAAIKDTSSYFVTDAIVEGEAMKIALLGMHVVGIVYNHPEFIWATFEHQDLVPYYDWEATTTSDIPVTSKTNKLLFEAGATATIANITSNNDPKTDSTNVFAVNRYGVPRQAGNTFLETSQKEPKNYNNIDAINTDVHTKLTDIWHNYFYNGSIWINTENYSYPTEQAQLLVSLGTTLRDPSPGKLPRGSVAAYNITMETYEQLGFTPTTIHGQNVGAMGNCFSCHSASRGSSLNISHIFNGAVGNKKGNTIKQTKQKHLDEIKAFIKQMK